MISPASLLTLAVAAGSAQATFTGFNYGNLRADGSVKAQADYEAEFKAAANLPGTNGIFRSGRIYTLVQGGTPNQPNAAIPAAISTKTSLLFGLWASAGQDTFNTELAALKNTIDQYCGQLDGLVAGISVGSEDLYRDSDLGKKSSNGLPGANAQTIVTYINEVRKATKGSCLEKVPVGHVDTWTAYVDDANKAVVDACDWLGMDTYPYFEDNKPNGIDLGRDLYVAALNKVKGAGGGKEVWITETGWPISGKTSGAAVPNKQNALRFWQEVGCPAFGKDNIWWYDLQDFTSGDVPNFGVLGADLNGPTNFDLSCKGHENPPVVSTSASAPSSTAQDTKSSEAPSTKSSAPAQQSSQPAQSSHGEQSTPAGTPTTLKTATGSPTNGGSQPTGGDSNQSSESPASSPSKTGAPSTVPTSSPNAAGKTSAMGAAAVAALMAFALL